MTLKQVTSILLVFGWLSVVTGVVSAQNRELKVRFEVEGIELTKPITIVFYFDGKAVSPQATANGFIVPDEAAGRKQMDLSVHCDGYDLEFRKVYTVHLASNWVFGVDKRPIDSNYAPRDEKKRRRVKAVYYLKTEPEDGDGFVFTIDLYTKAEMKRRGIR